MGALRTRRLVPVLAAAALSLAGFRGLVRLEVTGPSMLPALRPGDRVLALRTRRLRVGQVVAVRDPRQPSRVVVKRVAGRAPGGWRVLGDNRESSTDSRVFGVVPDRLVVGRVVYRYHPAEDAGRVPPGR